MTRKRSISKQVAMSEPKEIKLLKRIKGDVQGLGFRGQLVGVFGAFDTWPYMDFAAREIALTGDISLTSLYWYTPTKVLIEGEKPYISYERFPTKPFVDQMIPMREFLQFLIKAVDKAVVIFSVSAAHYIEMEWLYNKVISIPMGNFKALGVCLGRPFPGAVTKAANNCPCLKLLESKLHIGEYIAICEPSADWSGWKCAEVQGFCPFVRQDISKNVLEYFFSPNMELVAVEHLGDVSQVLNKFLD